MRLAIVLDQAETSKWLNENSETELEAADNTADILSDIFILFNINHIVEDEQWSLWGTGDCGNVYLLEEKVF